MTSISFRVDTSKQFDDNTNIDGAPITCYMGKDSKVLDFEKGAIGVVTKNRVPTTQSPIPVVDFVRQSASIAALLNEIQFNSVLQMETKGYKQEKFSSETKETSNIVYGTRNVKVHPGVAAANRTVMSTAAIGVPFGSMMYLYPSLVPKKRTALTNLYEFYAVNYETLIALLNNDYPAWATMGADAKVELLSRLAIGTAFVAKPAEFTNIPVRVGARS